MTESTGSERVTCKRRHPNKLYQKILEGLYRAALETNSKIVPSLKEAISSLEKYPLPLSSGAECAILKGFDPRLCRYIDAHIKSRSTKYKKTKVCDSEFPTKNVERLKVSPPKEVISNSKMTSNTGKESRNDKELETNTEKCSFKSKFGEPSLNRAANSNQNRKTVPQLEQNNNTATNFPIQEIGSEQEPIQLDSNYFVNRSRIDSDDSVTEESQDNLDDIHFDENWESFKNDQPSMSRLARARLLPPCQLIEVLDLSDNESSVTEETLTNKNESVELNQECFHNVNVPCNNCECIASAADAFQSYYKEKTKKEAEDTSKCVLPRKMYKPAYRSGAYAILVALLEQCNECPYRDCLTKEELIQKAQMHTDQSFTNPKLESNYTAWTNAKRLISKGMIQITNYDNKNDDFYMLTAMGRLVARGLVNENTRTVTVNDVIFHGQRNDRVPLLEDDELVPPPPIASLNEDQSTVFIEMPPGTFDIVLLIDKHEQLDSTLSKTQNIYCKYESRSLNIGDFLWVARSKKTGQELVLPFIVERKRIDDLASSIKDGRYHEQKFRLRKCGLNNVCYLVENYKKKGQYILPVATLMQAVANTSVLEEFNVVKTDTLYHTCQFLGTMSETLVHQYLPVVLRGCNKDTQGKELMTFEYFNKFSAKNKPLTVRDTFIKMLLQLKGLSIEKALAITNTYSTPKLLMKAYNRSTVKEGELLLAGLKFNQFTRNVGPAVSKTVYKLFCKEI